LNSHGRIIWGSEIKVYFIKGKETLATVSMKLENIKYWTNAERISYTYNFRNSHVYVFFIDPNVG
jgi:general stress protein 26